MYGCIGVIFTWIVCFDSKFSCGKIESKNQKLGYFNCREKKCRIKEKKKKISMNLPSRNRSIFLPIGTIITLFFVITWHDDSNPVSLRRLIRFAKIKNATERIYRRSLTRVYEHSARISSSRFFFILSFLLLSSPFLAFLSSPFLSFLFFVHIPFLFLFSFFFFLNFSIINSTIISRTLNSTNVSLLYRVARIICPNWLNSLLEEQCQAALIV